MPTLNQATGKRFGYFSAGIIIVTASYLASFAIASTGMLFFALAIAFIKKPFGAFIPTIISTLFLTLFWAWAVENISKSDNYDPADEVEWAYMLRELGYEGELSLLFEEGRGGLYGSPTNYTPALSAILSRQ